MNKFLFSAVFILTTALSSYGSADGQGFEVLGRFAVAENAPGDGPTNISKMSSDAAGNFMFVKTTRENGNRFYTFYRVSPKGKLLQSFQIPDDVQNLIYHAPQELSDGRILIEEHLYSLLVFSKDGKLLSKLKIPSQFHDFFVAEALELGDGTIVTSSAAPFAGPRGGLYTVNPYGTFEHRFNDGDFIIGKPVIISPSKIFVSTTKTNYILDTRTLRIRKRGNVDNAYYNRSMFYHNMDPKIGYDGNILTHKHGSVNQKLSLVDDNLDEVNQYVGDFVGFGVVKKNSEYAYYSLETDFQLKLFDKNLNPTSQTTLSSGAKVNFASVISNKNSTVFAFTNNIGFSKSVLFVAKMSDPLAIHEFAFNPYLYGQENAMNKKGVIALATKNVDSKTKKLELIFVKLKNRRK